MVNTISAILAKIVLGAFFLALLWTGIFVGGTALHDPDTCWLLALGRFMVENHHLPTSEPFSFTFADLNRPLVLYQWLTECSSYALVKLGGLVTLLTTITLLVMTAFVVIPLRLCSLTKTSWTISLAVIFIGLQAASFHFLARPEIVSYLLLSLSLFLLSARRFTLRSAAPEVSAVIDWKFVALQAAIMVAWANCHTGFTSGLAVLLTYVVFDTAARFAFRLQQKTDRTVLVALLVCVAASACNPYGISLWFYIPSLFFAKFNYLIAELHAISFQKPEFYPFMVLLVVYFLSSYKRAQATFLAVATRVGAGTAVGASNGVGFVDLRSKVQLIQSLGMMAVSSFEACTHLRLIPFAVLILINEVALLLSPLGKPGGEPGAGAGAGALPESTESPGLLSYFDAKLAEGLAPPVKLGGFGCSIFVLLVAAFGTLLTCLHIQAPVLPQSGPFNAPFKAMDALCATPMTGNLFNDAQFGDLLIWYHPDHPQVFIDTRYDMYGENLVHDYLNIAKLEPGWQQLLEKYKINAVYMPPSTVLAQKLSGDPAWKVIYSDKSAVVLCRR